MKEKGVEIIQELIGKKSDISFEVNTFTEEVEKASGILQKKKVDDDDFISNLSNLVDI